MSIKMHLSISTAVLLRDSHTHMHRDAEVDCNTCVHWGVALVRGALLRIITDGQR